MSLDEAIKVMSTDMLVLTRPVVGKSTKRISEALTEYYNSPEGMRERRFQKRGVPTGFRDLGPCLGAISAGRCRSWWAYRGGENAVFWWDRCWRGRALGLRTIFVSLERSRDQIIEILLSIETGIPTDKMRNNELTDKEFERIV